MNHSSPHATADDYARAERFLPWNKDRYVVNADIQHRWIGNEDRFWYRRTNEAGQKEFVVVEAQTGERTPAFDHQGLAVALSKALGRKIDSGNLPFTSFRYSQDEIAIEFLIADQLWSYSLEGGNELGAKRFDRSLAESVSPDGKWAAFVRDHNLWIRPTSEDAQFALTTDGIEHHGYAGAPGISLRAVTEIRSGAPTPPLVLWSPDSRYLLSHQLDERKVKDFHLVQSAPEDGGVRPKLYAYRYSLPGDEHVPLLEPVVFDVVARREIRFAIEPLVCDWWTLIEKRMTWWSPDSRAIYFLHRDRFATVISLYKVDPLSGTVSELLRETGDDFSCNDNLHVGDTPRIGDWIRTLANGDIIWYSPRSGWGHLYYYSSHGELLHPITQGEWLMRYIVRVDEVNRRIFFTASGREPGRDPYEQRLYRIQLDGSGLTLLTPEEAEHRLVDPIARHLEAYGLASSSGDLSTLAEKECFSASGRYFVDSYSRPDVPSVLVLRDCEGRLIQELERADISRLSAGGYTPVEPFQVLAADGATPIYGNLYRPSHFDPARKYPILDANYPAWNMLRAAKGFTEAVFDRETAQGLAELGFIVVTIDGRGTPHRSKAFRNYAHGRLHKVSELQDHIAGIRQLAKRYTYIDVSRVGIFGSSGGGFMATLALLTHPDFYKVAVSTAGNHDQRANLHTWGETCIGPLETGDYAASATPLLAANLQGKLLLMHGELDDNVHPAHTMKLVDALIKANKDFDLLILPNDNHYTLDRNPYFIRREWDYFVRHLLGAQPPANYAITPPHNDSL